MAKERLDLLLTNKGLFPSRERARSAIMAGRVLVDGKKVDKAGSMTNPEAKIVLVGQDMQFVSRGGLKLSKALKEFSLDLAGKVMIDIGASTGGFTDCALQQGAVKVFAIDVGYGQLAWALRTDQRVVNMERTNIRNVTTESIGELVDFISIDVAFISLDKVLPVAVNLLQPDGAIVALIKPQFEAGRDRVGKKGVVKDAAVHYDVIKNIVNFVTELGLYPLKLTFSPVKGPEGNIEYLLYMSKTELATITVSDSDIQDIVSAAHATLLVRTEGE